MTFVAVQALAASNSQKGAFWPCSAFSGCSHRRHGEPHCCRGLSGRSNQPFREHLRHAHSRPSGKQRGHSPLTACTTISVAACQRRTAEASARSAGELRNACCAEIDSVAASSSNVSGACCSGQLCATLEFSSYKILLCFHILCRKMPVKQ